MEQVIFLMEGEVIRGRLSLESDSSESEGTGESPATVRRQRTDMYRPSQLRKVALARRPGVSLPYHFMQSPEIARGIAELDNFGFRTNVVLMDPTRTFVMTGRRKQAGFHVSDLWSQKQQQEFLKRLRLERAQFARERQVSFVNYLIQNKKKLLHATEQASLPGRYSHAFEGMPNFRSMDKIALLPPTTLASARSLSELPLESLSPLRTFQSWDKAISMSAKKRLSKVEGLITHCTSTLLNLKKSSKELAQSVKISKAKKEPLFLPDPDELSPHRFGKSPRTTVHA